MDSSYQEQAWLTLDLFSKNDDDRPVYLTGNFNDWTPNDKMFKMNRLDYGRYQITLKNPLVPEGEALQYKYVKGNWSGEELLDTGLPAPNRTMHIARGGVTDVVGVWKENPGSYAPRFFPKIEIVSHQIQMPELSTNRRVSVLLPYNYDENTDKKYPVIYLQDGQNLFEDDAPYGSWNLDHYLGQMAEEGHGEFIVVAIDHGGKNRIKEYSPYPSKTSKEALGKAYARFLAKTLKPFIDNKYRTLEEPKYTALGGSSMGALITVYAGIQYPELFSKYLIFSPSLWVSERIYEESAAAAWLSGSSLYLFAGAKEGFSVVENLTKWAEIMQTARPDLNFDIKIDPDATHSEAYWGRAFPIAMKTLFGSTIDDSMVALKDSSAWGQLSSN